MKKFISLFFISTLILFIGGLDCLPAPHSRCTPTYYWPDQTHYDVSPNVKTTKNIDVDTSGLNINLEVIDRLTSEVETCLSSFGNPPHLNNKIMIDADCQSETFDLPIHTECLTVKVAKDWFLSDLDFAGSKQQLLPYVAGYGDCGKNFSYGPCYWRAGIQDNLTIVSTPSFYLYKEPILKIATGCKNPWNSPELAACMVPTTNALDDGNQP